MTHMYGFNYDQKINKKFSLTPQGVMNVNIDNPVTAFGDLRTAELTPQAHLTFPYNYINPDIVTVGTSNGGSSFTGDSMIGICTGTATNGSAYFESRDIVKYRSGLGSMVRFTCIYNGGSGVADSEQLAGIGDDEDGYFFGYNGTSFGTMRLDNGVSNWTYQSDWNLDTFNGINNGNPSGITLDTSKINVFQIEYQWLGGGQIQYSIENPDTGLLTPVNKIKYSNNNTKPSVANPSLPLTGRVKNFGSTTNINIKIPSMGGFVQGKSIVSGPIKSYYTTVNSDGSQVYLFSLRNVETFNNIKNRVRVYLRNIAFTNDNNKLANFTIYKNIDLGDLITWSTIEGSVIEYNNSFEGSIYNPEKIIYRTTVGKDSGITSDLTNLNLFLAPEDTISICGETTATGTSGLASSITWIEDF